MVCEKEAAQLAARRRHIGALHRDGTPHDNPRSGSSLGLTVAEISMNLWAGRTIESMKLIGSRMHPMDRGKARSDPRMTYICYSSPNPQKSLFHLSLSLSLIISPRPLIGLLSYRRLIWPRLSGILGSSYLAHVFWSWPSGSPGSC